MIAFPLRLLVRILRSLPLGLVARTGRLLGALAFVVDRRHRRQALDNLSSFYGDQALSLAREHFRRLGENYCCAIKAASMDMRDLIPHMEVVGAERILEELSRCGNVVVAIGHFGNFELFARMAHWLGEARLATTYRALKHPGADRVLAELRAQSGILFFERRKEGRLLRRALRRKENMVLGLLADQHDGGGVRTEFLGRECFSSPAPALLALRHGAALFTAICFRTGPARWRIEVGAPITLRHGRNRRPTIEITQDIQDALGVAVRRDPSNWFWVHRRWRP